MKEWKEQLASAIINRSESDKIIVMKNIAAEMGIRHITQQDTQDILAAVQKRLPGYRPVQFVDNPKASLFQSLAFVQNDVEFCGPEEFDNPAEQPGERERRRTMNKAQIESIKKNCIRNGDGIYDTRTYRYVLGNDNKLTRIRLDKLDTTAAYEAGAWERVEEPQRSFHVLPEYQDAWYGGLSTDEIGDAIVSEEEIKRLAREWGATVDELMEQVEEC